MFAANQSRARNLTASGDFSDESRDRYISKESKRHGEIDSLGHATSGARSAFPMTPFGDPFSLFNLFNIFKQPDNKLDESEILTGEEKVNKIGSLIQSDEAINIEQNDIDSIGLDPEDEDSSIYKLKDNSSSIKIRQFSSKLAKANDNQQPPSTVIMIPGFGGSRLEARWEKPSVVRYLCERKSDWTDIWVNLKLLLPYMIDCLIDNMRLEFDYATNTTRNPVGVEVRVKNESHISSIEYLNDLQIKGFAYFAQIIDRLVDEDNGLNYKREVSILGAPYDFRKAPNELSDYFQNLRLITEQNFHQNEQKAITFICHSMGCSNILYFLQRQPKHWKERYVRRLISLAAPWAGSLSALRAVALGDDLGMPYLFSESKLINVQRSLPSTIFLFPNKEAFQDVPLIRTNVGTASTKTNNQQAQDTRIKQQEQTYLASDLKAFFNDIDHPDGYRMWLETKDLLGAIEAPEVEVWCLVGLGQKTLARLDYTGEFPHSTGIEVFEDGDGTVSLQSAKYCKKWAEQQEQPVYYKEFNAGHMDILRNTHLLGYIERILNSEIQEKDAIK